ncbi:MAG: methylmalonyl-CoA mutase [Deltaproteobacteria bacterium CG12_big_fil_rev_8_21_14_0_65_43_10]|nr:MAG: methylmalonyl-CoA mutase [Deltaproteobacteria bacterium CG2_30_43_15]PIQ45715.1 MAG: methylmalonyl-CoA mutase [Deltaproteobacteria bacterium CG12_big_fil_rev_8_21_14_0_65_43_10]PIU86288.1 MAG: methylmalonyl-CoA mutase [Deltaproteobacteria bacterium CG06_land_8_20_14_3_00_44_19]PIX25682.1 MAG: methylmalonyl-CoA mutase [Deltaproteobacteria bacterium CG_4_8_14_3_um_filter_43_13]PIZ21237.1 MAG: methylmalonyl-CoA mutase [Deltaproteobacteria bacterium CG_4_10_14_0_8_um_filter_43_12]PJB38083.
MEKERKIKVLIAKPGLDGHDRGAKVLSFGLRDQGMEVIYTGRRQSAQQIVNSALQEDVDVVGLSILSGAHLTFFPKVMDLLRENDAGDMLVIGGGIIPEEHIPILKEKGVAEIFGPGTLIKKIAEYIKENVRKGV